VIDFRLTSKRDANAARAFIKQAHETMRIYAPVLITTDKAPAYARVISEMNKYSLPGKDVVHVNAKWRNNRIESDHAALKRITDPVKGLSLCTLRRQRSRVLRQSA